MKFLSLVIVLLLFIMPFLTVAQLTGDAAQAIIDAKKDANAENQHVLWGSAAAGTAILFGCLGGSIILGASFVHDPKPPIEKLIGNHLSMLHIIQILTKKQSKKTTKWLL